MMSLLSKLKNNLKIKEYGKVKSNPYILGLLFFAKCTCKCNTIVLQFIGR